MTIFDLSTRLCDIEHTLGSELICLGVWSRLMIAMLVDGGEAPIIVEDDVVFQFAHGMKLHARHLGERPACLRQRLLRSACQQCPIFVEEGAKHAKGGNLRERIDKCRCVSGYHIEVAAASLDKGEEAAAIHALTTGENRVKVCTICNDKIEGLEFSVTTRVHEIDHPYTVVGDEKDDVFFCELLGIFLQKSHHRVGIQC